MSIKHIFITSFLGFATAAVIVLIIQNNQPQNQMISKKLGFAKPTRTIAGKTNAMMDITIESLNGIPENDEQEIILKATLTLKRTVDSDLNYKWLLPEGVHVVAGHPEDGWNNILPGQTVSTEITVTGLSKESPGKAVVIHVESTSQGFKVGYSGVYAIDSEAPQPSEDSASGKFGKLSQQTKEEINAERLKGISF